MAEQAKRYRQIVNPKGKLGGSIGLSPVHLQVVGAKYSVCGSAPVDLFTAEVRKGTRVPKGDRVVHGYRFRSPDEYCAKCFPELGKAARLAKLKAAWASYDETVQRFKDHGTPVPSYITPPRQARPGK